MENHGEDLVVSRTRRWLTHAVVGLNLCPFAKAVMAKGQVHYTVTPATGWNDLLAALEQEVDGLMACAPELRDTSLLIAPQALPDFFEFNGFIGEAEHYRVHLLYQPDQAWLRSEAAVLTETKVEAIVAGRPTGQRSLVFAAAKYLSQKDLTGRGVEFCQLPYAIHRILGEPAPRT